MEYRVLGKTGLSVSRLGFGGIPIQRIDREGTQVLLRRLSALGVNYIDTARGYTVSEEYIGYALEGLRDRFILATKSMARDREGMAQDIERSLHSLKTGYIELYQIHNPSLAQLEQVLAPGGAMEALLEAREAGKIGHIGLTAHSLEVFARALEEPMVETVMFPYNPVETQGEELIRRCAERNVGFIAMKPLAGGAIEDAGLALRFIASNPCVSVVIPGMAELAEVEENVRAVSDPSPLREEEREALRVIAEELGTHFCRRCGYCAPCTAGINIPSVFLFEGYLSRYGLEDWARSRYGTLAKTASDCVACGVCESRCPYGLPIRQMMKTAAERFAK